MSMVDLPDPVPDTRRVRVMTALMILGLLSLVARLWYLQIAKGQELWELSEGNHTRLIRRLAPRGLVEDHTGKVLATSRNKIVVSVIPDELHKNPAVLPLLAGLLNVPEAELRSTIAKEKITNYDPVRVALDVGIDMATRIEERRLDLPGVAVGPEPVRFYPDGSLLGHVLGQMGEISPDELRARTKEGYRPGDYCGKLGIERAYDRFLHGKDGGREVEVDARGRTGAEIRNVDPIPGDTVRLTIDKQMQRVAYDELAAWAAKGDPGAAVALDPRSGAVRALVSVPSYDPNLFAQGITTPNWSSLRDNPLKPLINRAVGSAYAPGSTFKVITASAGLESGRITPSETAYCSGVMYLGRWAKHCWKSSGHGSVDMVDAIQKSCDIYFYRLAQRLGPDILAEWSRNYGLGERTGIDLVRKGDPQIERSGVVPDPAWKRKHNLGEWVGGETVDYGIGQAMLAVTPIQMCNVAAAIANGGTLYRPQLVETIEEYRGLTQQVTIHRLKPEPLRRVGVKDRTLQVVREGMLRVMQPGGTASHVSLPGITIAGKTGTAQMRKHGRIVNNAWFICYAPADNPTIAISVFIEGGGHGGVAAGPVARKMLAAYFHVKAGSAAAGASAD